LDLIHSPKTQFRGRLKTETFSLNQVRFLRTDFSFTKWNFAFIFKAVRPFLTNG
jgi:hypothetical protein